MYVSHFDLALLFKVLMATYFNLTTKTLKRESLTLLDGNVNESMSRQQKEKLQKTSKTSIHSLWNLEDFSIRLKLSNFGINPHHGINFLVLFFMSNLYKSLGKGIPTCSKWTRMNIWLLHHAVCAHPPTNGDYLGIFLWGWLAQWNRENVN